MSKGPSWLKVRTPTPAQATGIRQVRETLDRHRVHTICQGALCPNAVECWGAKTATFMILGEVCSRACRFCGVRSGAPGGRVDTGEPARVAEAVLELGLRYVVLTSVDRDDLEDGGAALFADTIERVKRRSPGVIVEALIPDFTGDVGALNRVAASGADVIGHNVETVESLTPDCRDRRASYRQSLDVLRHLSSSDVPGGIVKSGMMVGLGEGTDEILATFDDLHGAGVRILTVGQYLRPTPEAIPVVRHVPPEEFDRLAEAARARGIPAVVAGPLVRSSYHAEEAYREACG